MHLQSTLQIYKALLLVTVLPTFIYINDYTE